VVETSVIPEHLVSQLDCTSRISQVTFTEAAVQAALGLAIEMLLEPNLFEGRQSVKGVAPAAAFAVVGDAESFERLTLLLLRCRRTLSGIESLSRNVTKYAQPSCRQCGKFRW
jgi:hypothetical protein